MYISIYTYCNRIQYDISIVGYIYVCLVLNIVPIVVVVA